MEANRKNRIFKSNKNNITLLFDDDLGWTVSKETKSYVLKSQSLHNFIFWLPLLENDYNIIQNAIKSINSDIEFPIKELIMVGLQSNSIYWLTLAVDWLKEYEKSNDIQFAQSIISKIIENKKNPQKIRHILRSLGNG